jgi:cytochrome c-type biogenesis protein CcmH/NrfF
MVEYNTLWVFLAVAAVVGFGVWWLLVRKKDDGSTGTGDGSSNTGGSVD